jgi:hypothetical protein
MNPLGSFSAESVLEQGKSMVQKTGDVAMQGVKVTAQTAAAQMTGGNFGGLTDAALAIAAHDHVPQSVQDTPDNDQFVRELYGAEHNQQSQPNPTTSVANPTAADVTTAINSEEQHKLASTRQQLDMLIHQQHMDSYFNPTFNRAVRSEESVVEKHTREDEEKKFEEFEKQGKKPDFALQRAKTRTEMSPGASG